MTKRFSEKRRWYGEFIRLFKVTMKHLLYASLISDTEDTTVNFAFRELTFTWKHRENKKKKKKQVKYKNINNVAFRH